MAVKKNEQAGKYFENKFGGLHGEDTFTPWARAAFVNLVTPSAKFEPPKYGLVLLVPKSVDGFPAECTDKNAQLKVIQTMCKEMAAQMFGDDVPELEYPIFNDGDHKDYAEYDGYAGHWVISARNAEQPIMSAGQNVSGVIAGMWVRAQVQPYLNSKGFSYKLRGLKIVLDDGKRYGKAVSGTSLLDKLDDAVLSAGATDTVEAAPVKAKAAPKASALDVL